MDKTLIRFGTDGWRAVIAREYTFSNVERVAQAYADYLLQEQSAGDRLVVVGFDRRFLSQRFAQCAAEVLAGNGFHIALFPDAVPTPLISWAVKELAATGGVVITASHNPAIFNGFKIKAPWGGSASPETTAIVEHLVDANPPKRSPLPLEGQELLPRAIASYKQQIASYIDLDRLRAATATVVVDPMHGSGGTWVESFLKGGELKVKTIRSTYDPLFGGVNPEPIDSNLGALKQEVRNTNALVGLATDGDADRVGAVDENGATMTMHQVVPMVLLHLVRTRKTTGGIVRTFSQSVLLRRIAAAFNLPIYETPIGFKYIAELMLKDDILIGAEESGGIGVKGHIPERDGILNSLLFLEAIVSSGTTPTKMLAQVHKEFGDFHFARRDLHVQPERGQPLVSELAVNPPTEIAHEPVVDVETMDGTKLIFSDESWLLFRQSGTEPILRIYCEATSVAKMNAFLEAAANLAGY